MTAVTQLILIMIVYVSCFTPAILILNHMSPSPLVYYLYYINHVSNFFIYLAVNKEFRKEVKLLMNKLFRKETSVSTVTVFNL